MGYEAVKVNVKILSHTASPPILRQHHFRKIGLIWRVTWVKRRFGLY
jgi:hypothetical protein